MHQLVITFITFAGGDERIQVEGFAVQVDAAVFEHARFLIGDPSHVGSTPVSVGRRQQHVPTGCSQLLDGLPDLPIPARGFCNTREKRPGIDVQMNPPLDVFARSDRLAPPVDRIDVPLPVPAVLVNAPGHGGNDRSHLVGVGFAAKKACQLRHAPGGMDAGAGEPNTHSLLAADS